MSGYIGTQPVPQAVQRRENFTATAAQTTFNTAGYTPQFVDVFLNGIHLLNGEDYTASNGSAIVLTVSAADGDVMEIVSFEPFEVADQTFTGTTTTDVLTVTGAFTSPGIDDNATSTAMTIDSSENIVFTNNGNSIGLKATTTSAAYTGFEVSNSDGAIQLGVDNSIGTAFGTAAYAAVISAGNSKPLAFRTSSAERMRIGDDGKVGIGTTSLSSMLNIDGGVTSSLSLTNTYGYAGMNASIRLVSTDNTEVGYIGQNVNAGGITIAGGLRYFGSGNSVSDSTEASQITQSGGIIKFFANDGLTAGAQFNPAERMRVTTDGVMINTTTPRGVLAVTGAISSSRGVVNNSFIAKALGRTIYHVLICNNYSTGASVRSGAYYITTNNEGTSIVDVSVIHVHNGQAVNFGISNGNITVSGLSAGNNTVSVFHS